jgi:hypothetical protein
MVNRKLNAIEIAHAALGMDLENTVAFRKLSYAGRYAGRREKSIGDFEESLPRFRLLKARFKRASTDAAR